MPYVSLDLETTGLDPEIDEIIEVAAIRFDADGVIDTYHSLVNPGRKLEYRIALLTGIDPAELRERAALSAASPREVEQFIGLDPIVGQNPTFDTTFLARKGVQVFGPTYDTFELASLLLPDLRQHSLGAIADHLGIEFANAAPRDGGRRGGDARVPGAARAARGVAAGPARRGGPHRRRERLDAAAPLPRGRGASTRAARATASARASCTGS